ncbi:MAG: TIM barrel protein [Deinococcales bacterium]
MIFGAHSFLFTEFWTRASLAILDKARELGLGVFEIGVGDDVAFDQDLIEQTRQRAESLALDLMISPGGAWPYECDIASEDPHERSLGLAWHKQQLDLAHALHAKAYAGAIYGHPGTIKRRIPPVDELPRVAEGLMNSSQLRPKARVKVVLEPMSRFRTHLINTPEQALKVLDLANHENLYVLLDSYHLITEIRL